MYLIRQERDALDRHFQAILNAERLDNLLLRFRKKTIGARQRQNRIQPLKISSSH